MPQLVAHEGVILDDRVPTLEQLIEEVDIVIDEVRRGPRQGGISAIAGQTIVRGICVKAELVKRIGERSSMQLPQYGSLSLADELASDPEPKDGALPH
jgi:hypothetical protein